MSPHAVVEALERHGRGALFFSGGKESVVLEHMLRPYRDRLTLLWVNTGAMFPHMADVVRAFGKDWHLAEVPYDQAARFQAAGLPARIVHVANTPAGQLMDVGPRGRVMLSDWVSCCATLRGAPMLEYLRRERITPLIHGQRRADNTMASFGPAAEVLAPLWGWSDAQVYEYLEAHGLPLPEQYPEAPDSLECWNCTAEVKAERIRFMRRRYPEQLAQLVPML